MNEKERFGHGQVFKVCYLIIWCAWNADDADAVQRGSKTDFYPRKSALKYPRHPRSKTKPTIHHSHPLPSSR